MVAVSSWFRYIATKLEYSVSLTRKAYLQGQIADTEIPDSIWRNLFQGRVTFLHCNKNKIMGSALNGTLLVRKIPTPDLVRVRPGDVLLLKDPENTSNHLVRRLIAVEGSEMVSDDKNDEPFDLEKDQCWVLADNVTLKPKEAYDSRIFGPVTMSSHIVGRVIYCLRNAVDHGPVQNHFNSTKPDAAILEVELDVDEMAKHHKA